MSNDPISATFLLDTGPLSVLCGFPINQTPFIHTILAYTSLTISDIVLQEIGNSGKMARVITPLLRSQEIHVLETPPILNILDSSYSKMLGAGERSTIKCGLASGISTIIDDKDAFIVACRFNLYPIGFQDFLVTLANQHQMSKSTAIHIATVTARQFPSAYLTHTLDLLR